MLSWTLFIIHKALMAYIGWSSVLIVFNKAKWWHTYLVAGFLITQAIFGMCIVTWLENIVRPIDGFTPVSNTFILHNIIDQQYFTISRVVFAVLGVSLILQGATMSKIKVAIMEAEERLNVSVEDLKETDLKV